MRALFVAIVVVATASSSFAQIYGARRYTGRIQQQTRPAPPAAHPNAQQPAATPAPAQPAPPAAPVQQPQYYPVPQATPAKPVDPVKAAAEKAKNEEKQFDFFKRRAEEGSDHAQYELGLRYLAGKGVTADEKQGREWLEKAAKNGNTQASKKLAELGGEPDNKSLHETAPSAPSKETEVKTKEAEPKAPEAK